MQHHRGTKQSTSTNDKPVASPIMTSPDLSVCSVADIREWAQSQDIIKRKLAKIPKTHLPTITIDDILYQTDKTSSRKIPPDLNLTWFLRHCDEINRQGGIAQKEGQSRDITRAIFYYSLDKGRRFHRGTDSIKWSINVFMAMLANKNFRFPDLDAEYFVKDFLSAVLEHHKNPGTFTRQDAFIDLWRRSKYDFYTTFKTGQRRAFMRNTKRLNAEWQAEVEVRKAKWPEQVARIERLEHVFIPGPLGERAETEEHKGFEGEPVLKGNELLEALMEPMSEDSVEILSQENQPAGLPIVGIPTALLLLAETKVSDILDVLLDLYT